MVLQKLIVNLHLQFQFIERLIIVLESLTSHLHQLGKPFLKFLLIGVLNTIIGTIIMLVCYNIFHLGYWLSSALDYSLASIVSYILNKRFTFQYKGGILRSLVRFIINIAVCYFIAFGLARPMVRYVLAGLSLSFDKPTLENIAMLLGTGLFVIINFLGQRFFTFRENENSKFTHTML